MGQRRGRCGPWECEEKEGSSGCFSCFSWKERDSDGITPTNVARKMSRAKAILVATTLALGVLGIFIDHRHRQLTAAVARAHDKVLGLENALRTEREARTRAEKCQTPSLTSAAAEVPATAKTPNVADIREAARIEVRKALLDAAGEGRIAVDMSTAGIEAARFAMHEALAAEEPGWCSCPPPPNVTRLCAALSPPPSTCELRATSARAEADAMRQALLEANVRATEASENLVEAAARCIPRAS